MKKYLVAGLLLAALTVLPSVASAQSIADLLAKIEILKQQIAILQGQQNQSGSWCHTFNQNLGVGASDSEVGYLQTALEKEGFKIGDKTSYYGEITAAAVSRLQTTYASEILTPNGLSAPTGYFGPATRKKMNSLYGCSGIKPIETSVTIPSQPPFGCYSQYVGGPIICVDPPPFPVQPLTVTSPNGGEAWQRGTTQRIGWKTSNVTSCQVGQPCVAPQFTIYLNPAAVNCPAGQPCVTPQWKIAAAISGTNWYDWNVGKTTTDAPPAGAYYVQICSPTNSGQVCDQSDSYFSITN